MDFLMVAKPNGLWAWLINSIESGGIPYALTIILVTLIIKFVLIPADIFNKYSTKKNTVTQAKIKPELDVLKKRYASNQQLLNQKTMELYKRENYSMGGTCAGMLVYLVITMVVFFTLLSTLNNMAAFKIQDEYNTLYSTYQTEYDLKIDESANPNSEEEIALAKAYAQSKVTEKYGEIKEGFLWIKNIWRPDTSASVTLNYSNFVSIAKLNEKEKKGLAYEYSPEEQAIIDATYDTDKKKKELDKYTEVVYNEVMGDLLKVEEYSKWNGYYILSILAALLTFGSLKLNTIIAKIIAKKKGVPAVITDNKMMSIIMPIIMGAFTLLYNSAFGLYIVAGAIFGFLTTPLVTLIVDKFAEKTQNKKDTRNKVSYDRTLKK